MDAISAEHSLKVVALGGGLLILWAIICLKIKNWTPGLLTTFYILIALTTVLSTAYLAFSTINLNVTSSSGGPVHWHADFEIWNCGTEVNLKDPTGAWSNKIGTATLHEHNDKRIHLEGVVVERTDASLGRFFQVVGGEINSQFAIVPTNEGPLKLINGQSCNGKPAALQVFAYRVTGKNYRQEKVANPESFIIAPQSQVPSGDCIIVEFDNPKSKTDKLCRSYQVAKQIGKLGAEVP